MILVAAASCVPQEMGQPTLLPMPTAITTSATSRPTHAASPTASPPPTITPTPVPLLEVGNLQVPDPGAVAPDLLSIDDPLAAIPQFVEAMNMAEISIAAEQVASNLEFVEGTGATGTPYVLGVYNFDPDPEVSGEVLEGPVPLFLATYNQGTWAWGRAWSGDVATLTGRLVGTTVVLDNLQESSYRDLVLHFSDIMEIDAYWNDVLRRGVTVEQVIARLKEGAVDPAKQPSATDLLDFSDYDRHVLLATRNGMLMEGQPLFAPWLIPDATKAKLISGEIPLADFELFLKFYTQALVTHYDGHLDPGLKVDRWVVANEITAHWMWWDSGGRTLVSRLISQGTLSRMFLWARESNPDAKLILNEDHLLERQEYELRSNYLYVLRTLQSQGAPVDVAGIQNHLWLGRPLLSPGDMDAFLQKIGDLGLSVDFTEITISKSQENQFTGESVSRPFPHPYLSQASYLRDILDPMLVRNGMIIFFGITDFPGSFDSYNLNDSSAEAMMFIDYAHHQPRPMYYVLMQYLIQGHTLN